MKTNSEDTAERLNSNKIGIYFFNDNPILLYIHCK